MVDGFYALYFTGTAGSGLAMIALMRGIVAGVDVGGVTYDGKYTVDESRGIIEGQLTLTAPPGTPLVTRTHPESTPATYHIPFSIPVNLEGHHIVRLETPTGPINARFKKIRDLPV